MPDTFDHPSPEKLAAYGLGQLPPDQATLVERHITECEPCCETIFDLSSGDTFVDLLNKAKHAPTEQTVGHHGQDVGPTEAEVPAQLAEHPRYEIVGLIGKGGMGDVYQARHRKMDRIVALKVINREFVCKSEAVDRFHREVKTAAQLSHPNIVTAHDADNAGDYHFMVMEYVDGVDLSRIIKDRGALPVAEACNYIHQAAIGLQHAHEQGMVHRDIKPHNLMFTADGTVKILDFGLAALAPSAQPNAEATDARSDLTAVGAIMGTPDFISPEQANDARRADIRSDIYSLGATLYFLLAGRPPFAEGSVQHKLQCHARADAERLDSLREDIPAELASVVTNMISKNPDERFQTPAEVATALEPYLQATKPEQESPRLQVHPDRKRTRLLPLMAVATVFAAALVASVLFYLQTGNGTIRVALLDESLEATIDGQKIEVKDGDKAYEISAGRQKLVIRQKGSDAEFVTDNFRVWRNDEIKFDVKLIVGKVVVTKDGKPFDRMKSMPPSIESLDNPQKALADRATRANIANAKEILGFKGNVTPEAMVAALDAGLFAYPLDKNHPESDQPSSWGGPIRLRTSVRGEVGPGTLFSPVIDLLSVVAKPNAEVTEDSILNLDRKLVELCEQRGRYRIEAGVAATVFAFQRGDLKAAMKRMKDLRLYGNYFRSRSTPFDLNLWLAVRNALNLDATPELDETPGQEPEETIAVAKILAEYAVKAARNSDEPRVEQAVLGERRQLLQRDRLELAKAAFARGEREEANKILRTIRGVGSAAPLTIWDLPKCDSDTAVAFKLAELLEEESDWSNAADAYLEAYRGEIRLLSIDQLTTFKKCGRTSEFVETLIEANVSRLDGGYLPIKIVESLLNDENTRADGDQLLKHLWAHPESILFSRLLGQPEIWKLVPDLSYYLRVVLLPTNIGSEGAGWGRFKGLSVAETAAEPVRGIPLNLRPLLHDKAAVRKLAEEVEAAIEKHPNWKAGPAVLAYLEVVIGNNQRATELIRQVLADAETRPIPSDSAFLFGMALEGKDPELDRQVMRLYENSLLNRPARVFRASAIPKLARLHAKYDDRDTARQVLHRLEQVDYDPIGLDVLCSPARRPETTIQKCYACHSGKSNLLDVIVMSNNLTDVGYPVDALISLARINASFGNAYGSDDAWAKQVLSKDTYVNIARGQSRFVPAKTEAENKITPQAVLEALKSGAFSDRDMTKPAPENARLAIKLMTSVRGIDGKSTLFSPALEVLELAAKAKGDAAAVANVQIDQVLSQEFDKNPDNVDVGIAATVFAFLRNDLDAAEKRSTKLNEVVAGQELQQRDIALWLVSRLALANNTTARIGQKLSDRSAAAAEMQEDKSWKEAIDRERNTLAAAKPVSSSMEGFLKAKTAYVRAKRLEKSGDIEKAADAYLEAYRGDPTLLAFEQFATIKNAKRVREFVEVFNADRILLAPLTGNPVERIAKALVEDQATRLDGRALLDQMWEARPDDQWPLLGNPPEDSVFQIGEPLLEIRKQPYKNEKRPPTDPDWRRFRPMNGSEAKGEYTGLLQKLSPQLKDTVEQKICLAKTIREVESTIDQDPLWKAGVGVLAYLEAELGNERRAIELIETTLKDTENPITCLAASTFGQALEGKSAELDQVVIRLYEKSVAGWSDFDSGQPYESLSYSPIQNLAGLYAKHGRREEARRLLLRLTIPEGIGVGGSKNTFVTCPPGRVLLNYSDSGPKDLYPKVRTEDQVPDVNCMACHRKERNLFSYLTMSNKLADLGYPVDARLSLARIDASFGNSYSSDSAWRQAKTPKLQPTSQFRRVRKKVDQAITPQTVLEALEYGAFNDIDLTKPVIAKNATRIDLMLSVRGEYGKSTLFSPVVDLLELAAKSEGDEAAIAIVQIDQLLGEEFEQHPANVEAGIAATVFAFLRGDRKVAEERLQKLSKRITAQKPRRSDIALWLVASLALDKENTAVIGGEFAKRAFAAAEKSADLLFKEAIVLEREAIAKIVALRNGRAANNAPASAQKDLIDTAASGDVFNTLVAAVKAAGLTQTLAESGPFTILAPTDEAFAKLPDQTLKDLLKPENKDKLVRVLKYHVIPGRMPSSVSVAKWAVLRWLVCWSVRGESATGVALTAPISFFAFPGCSLQSFRMALRHDGI